MANKIQRVEYFHINLKDEPGEAYKLLSDLKELGINLLAITAIPSGDTHTHITLFPEDSLQLTNVAKNSGMELEGPHPALLVQGDDELGALAEIHQKLFEANINVYASSGIADGKGSFGYLFYIRPEQFDRAAIALGI